MEMIILSITNRVFSQYILDRYEVELNEFLDVALPIISEKIVKLQSAIVKEVMNNNTLSVVSSIRENVRKLDELQNKIFKEPLNITIDMFKGLDTEEVEPIRYALEALESRIKRKEFEVNYPITIDHDELVTYIMQELDGVGIELDEDIVNTVLDLEYKFLEIKGLMK